MEAPRTGFPSARLPSRRGPSPSSQSPRAGRTADLPKSKGASGTSRESAADRSSGRGAEPLVLLTKPWSINMGSVRGGLMNRTAATCIAGMRSRATSRIRIHFFQPRVGLRFFALRVLLLVAIHSAPLQSAGASIDKKAAHTMMEVSVAEAFNCGTNGLPGRQERSRAAFLDPKAAEHRRTPQRGRLSERTILACVLECGGAPPLLRRAMSQDCPERASVSSACRSSRPSSPRSSCWISSGGSRRIVCCAARDGNAAVGSCTASSSAFNSRP